MQDVIGYAINEAKAIHAKRRVDAKRRLRQALCDKLGMTDLSQVWFYCTEKRGLTCAVYVPYCKWKGWEFSLNALGDIVVEYSPYSEKPTVVQSADDLAQYIARYMY